MTPETFRRSKVWQNFRKEIIQERKTCELCGSKSCLTVHHRDMNKANYCDISDKQHFSLLCRKCHRWIHLIYQQLTCKNPKVACNEVLNIIYKHFIMGVHL